MFPSLARAIAAAAPAAPLPEVREAALIALYRLLFLFYAEDRGLLPVRDPRYEAYALRENLREHVGERMDKRVVFSATPTRYWQIVDDLCRIIDRGDPALGLPPYNGGLFDRERAPLLAQIRVPDATMAEIVDALSFERGSKLARRYPRRYVNYRDLGVQQLGSIYERLLEREVVRENGAVVVRPNRFARKDSGSFYTPDDLVGLIVSETLDPLVRRRIDAFENKAAELRASGAPRERRLAELRPLDPAERLVELRVCDPAMGSGHFLVAATDYLTDRIVACMAEAEGAAEGYVSPLMERVEAVRETILRNAEAGGWAIDAERLDDRHIVRRMALKRCVFGVDKNPMAVELAKVTLWLHTFTAGAPLSFLDHHLRCGDSLFGSWVRGGLDRAEAHGNALFPVDSLRRARGAVRGMAVVESLTDAEIAEADRSAEAFADVRARTAPLDAFLSLVHALDWLNISTKADRCALHLFLCRAPRRPRRHRARRSRTGARFARSRAVCRDTRARPLHGHSGTLFQLADRLSRRVDRLGERRPHRRLRRRYRQPPVGQNENSRRWSGSRPGDPISPRLPARPTANAWLPHCANAATRLPRNTTRPPIAPKPPAGLRARRENIRCSHPEN